MTLGSTLCLFRLLHGVHGMPSKRGHPIGMHNKYGRLYRTEPRPGSEAWVKTPTFGCEVLPEVDPEKGVGRPKRTSTLYDRLRSFWRTKEDVGCCLSIRVNEDRAAAFSAQKLRWSRPEVDFLIPGRQL